MLDILHPHPSLENKPTNPHDASHLVDHKGPSTVPTTPVPMKMSRARDPQLSPEYNNATATTPSSSSHPHRLSHIIPATAPATAPASAIHPRPISIPSRNRLDDTGRQEVQAEDSSDDERTLISSSHPETSRPTATLTTSSASTINSAPEIPISSSRLSRQYPGKRIGERYTLSRRILGRGHAGEVYEGWDEPTGARLAIKVLRKRCRFRLGPWIMETDKHRRHNRRLFREMDVGESLKDIEGVYRPFDAVETKTHVYLIMHAAEGDLMHFVLDPHCHWNEEHYRILLEPVFETLANMHKAGFAHRDIKLENLLVFRSGKNVDLMLTDLEMTAPLTRAHARDIVGTREYCAPEITAAGSKRRSESVDYALADAWSLGVTLFACLTGCFPFGKVTRHHGLRDQSVVEFQPCQADRVSEDAKDLIRKLLTYDPRKRLTIRQALQHPWFTHHPSAPSSIPLSSPSS